MSEVGRPTVMNDLTLGKLRDAFLFGCTDEEACLYADINPATLYKYQTENPEYIEKKRMWKHNPIMLARKTVYDKMADDGELSLKFLERKKKDEFSLKVDQEIKQDTTLTINWKNGDNDTVQSTPTLPTDTPEQ